MAPKRVQLSLSEKNAIAALHKAGLKGAAITREMGYPLSTVYCVLKRIRQHGTVEISGRPSLLTPQNTIKLYGVVKSDRKLPLQEVTNIFNE